MIVTLNKHVALVQPCALGTGVANTAAMHPTIVPTLKIFYIVGWVLLWHRRLVEILTLR